MLGKEDSGHAIVSSPTVTRTLPPTTRTAPGSSNLSVTRRDRVLIDIECVSPA